MFYLNFIRKSIFHTNIYSLCRLTPHSVVKAHQFHTHFVGHNLSLGKQNTSDANVKRYVSILWEKDLRHELNKVPKMRLFSLQVMCSSCCRIWINNFPSSIDVEREARVISNLRIVRVSMKRKNISILLNSTTIWTWITHMPQTILKPESHANTDTVCKCSPLGSLSQDARGKWGKKERKTKERKKPK